MHNILNWKNQGNLLQEKVKTARMLNFHSQPTLKMYDLSQKNIFTLFIPTKNQNFIPAKCRLCVTEGKGRYKEEGQA